MNETMNIDSFRTKQHLLIECISGSRAYGLDTTESDTDIRGIFVLPKEQFYSLGYIPQVANETNDIVYYELERFFELLARNNPNILEMLFMPEECILYRHPLFALIKPEVFVSKLCRETFAGYAVMQIKKARGLKKKIVNPMPEERKSILAFCRIITGSKSIPLSNWLSRKNIEQTCCGLAAIPHARDLYALFVDQEGALGLRGIVKGEHSQDITLSSIPKGLHPAAIVFVNKDGYSRYCREYQEYWEWVKHRNEARYRGTVAHGKQYDAKNLMHTFRLLDIAEEIACTGRFTTRRTNREELLAIKAGAFEYETLLQKAQEKLQAVKRQFEASSLPEKPDEEKVNSTLVMIRERFYREKWP